MHKKIGAFVLKEKIEEGNYANVYKAEDANKTILAIKCARENIPEYNELITREFQVLSQFKHPNIVQIYDYETTSAGLAFFSLEYIEGVSINKCFRGFSEDFVSALIQIILALGAFHKRGFVHSDLKPEHVIYSITNKKAILIDFGFAGISAQKTTSRGTLGYIAPEIIKGFNADQRSDLYSLGVIIYEVLSGSKPTASYLNIDGIPAEVNSMIAQLLSREPALRPSLPEIHAILSKYIHVQKPDLPAYSVDLPITVFVNIPEIEKRIAAATGKTLILNGAAGSGKTRYLKELKYRYLMCGCSVMFFIPAEGSDFQTALANFISREIAAPDEKKERFQVYDELLQNLLVYSKSRQVLILLDDLDKLTDYELGLFRYIGHGIETTNISIIGAATPSNRVTEMGFENLDLRPLSMYETGALLEKTFAALEPVLRTDEIAGWLHAQSGGNPYYIIEILKTLHKSGRLQYKSGKWVFKPDELQDASIPHKLEDMLMLRIKNLTEKEIEVLRVIAFAGAPIEPSLIHDITGTEPSIILENLKGSDLLREEFTGNRRLIMISNQILIDLLERNLNPLEKSAVYTRICRHVEERFAKEMSYIPVLARLFETAAQLEKAYKYYLSALENAEKIYDYESSLIYCNKVIEYCKKFEPKRYYEFLLKRGDLHQILGHNQKAIEDYKMSLDSKSKTILPKIYFGLGKAYSTIGEHNEAASCLEVALKLIKDSDSTEFINVANRLAYSLLFISKFENAENVLNKSLLDSRKIKDLENEAETQYYRATLQWFKGEFKKGIEIAKELLSFCEKHRLVKQQAFSANLLSSFYLQKGETNIGLMYINHAVDSFNGIKQINALCAAMNIKGTLLLAGGNIQQAISLFEAALIRAKQTGNQAVEHVALLNLAFIWENHGRYERAIDYNEQVLRIEPDSPHANYNLAMVHYKTDEIDRAKSILEEKLETNEEILYYIGLAFMDMVMGKIEKAEQLLSKGLNKINAEPMDTSVKIEIFLKTAEFYYETGNFEKSQDYTKKLMNITCRTSREFNIAAGLTKINEFRLKKKTTLDIDEQANALKNMGCLYDYAYLCRLSIESTMKSEMQQSEVKNQLEKLASIEEIFKSVGAKLELNRVQKLKQKLFPIVVKDYSRRIFSVQYLETFSKLAELITSHLGDIDFIQQILDLAISTTHAERGALFLKSGSTDMKLVAGRNIDKTTIKDAGELSLTAIEGIDRNQIIFSQNALDDPKFSIRKSVMINKIRSLLCIPLSVQGNTVGAIYLDSRMASDMFGPDDKEFLLAVSKILASVIEKSLAFRNLTEEIILLKSNVIKEIGKGYLIGESKTIKKIYELIESIAPTDSPVLILGETGVGKGMIARLIHLKSKRKEHKFQSINCGTIPETLLESELFGHKRGAFTGAVNDKKGLLDEGEAGTVFLDEITNTSPLFQAKILEAIEEKVIRRIGETQTRKIDVRFLFATNKDLEIEVEEGRFRKDLFYRINVFTIEVPSLRERVDDIPLLAQFFLELHSKNINKKIDGFTSEAIKALKKYLWPGNARELQNVIERAIVLSKTSFITPTELGMVGLAQKESVSLDDLKKDAIIDALNATGWKITRAAELLGISRTTLWRYINMYKIKE